MKSGRVGLAPPFLYCYHFNRAKGDTLKPWPEFVEGLFGGGLAFSINFFVSFYVGVESLGKPQNHPLLWVPARRGPSQGQACPRETCPEQSRRSGVPPRVFREIFSYLHHIYPVLKFLTGFTPTYTYGFSFEPP
jgi:hypothetical protein